MHQCMHVPFARIYIPLSPKKNETLGGLKLRIFLDAEHLHHLYTFSTRCMPAYKRYTPNQFTIIRQQYEWVKVTNS